MLSPTVNMCGLLAYCKTVMEMCLLAKGTKMAAFQSDVIPPLPASSTEHSLSITNLTDAITVF